MAKAKPFIVLSLPRSRSAWLANFLSYGDWACGHDQLRYMRSLDDVKAWLSLEKTGTCETAGAPFWRLLPKYAPDAKVITIRRPVPEVVESLRRMRLYDDLGPIQTALERMDRKLDQIERRLPNVRSVAFSSLADEGVCASLFEHCLPYRHDPVWWKNKTAINVQINYPSIVRYVEAHAVPLKKLVAQARQAMLKDLAVKVAAPLSIDIRAETFEDLVRDGQHLFQEHCAIVGEHPDNWMKKNIPLMRKLYDLGIMQIMIGRSNGKAFGYLMTLICPSLEEEDRMTAQHAAFFASASVPGLGLKLQRASLAALKDRGVHETFMRAGIRGDGDKMDVLYRRLGGQDFGRMYRVELGA